MTNQKKIALAYIIAALILVCFFVFKSYLKLKNPDTSMNRKSPFELGLLNMDSSLFKFGTTQEKILILYFDSECEHCQYEIDQMKNRYQELNALYDIVLVSSEPFAKINAFSVKHSIQDLGISIARIDSDQVTDAFGTVITPHILIYNHDGHLLNEFNGEIKIDALFEKTNEKKN